MFYDHEIGTRKINKKYKKKTLLRNTRKEPKCSQTRPHPTKNTSVSASGANEYVKTPGKLIDFP